MTDHHVRISNFAVARWEGRLLTIGLGSCVAIALYDPAHRVAGLAHVLLPDPSVARDAANPARFASTAVPLLVREMRALGGRGPLAAKLAGGASLFGNLLGAGGAQMGARNVAAARAALERAGIAIVGAETGGASGRSVALDVPTGRFSIRSVRGGEHVL